MKMFQVRGTKHPTPQTVDILAEVSEWRAGRNLGWSVGILEGLLATVTSRLASDADKRDALKRLAATAVARIELMDEGKI